MNRQELIEKVNTYPNSDKLPVYVEADDVSDGSLLINGKWENSLYSWGIIDHDGKWIFFLTDEERGYVTAAEIFDTESEACGYAAERLLIKAKSLTEKTPSERLVRFIQKRFKYSEENAAKAVIYLLSEPDIFAEFYDYAIRDEFPSKNAVEAAGFTARNIHNNYGATPVEAYIYLAYLRKDPEKALAQLKEMK